MTILFTSDTHFGHDREFIVQKRGFSSVDEMNEELIDRWNSKVKPNDTIWHIGDFAFYRSPEEVLNILRRLNGKKYYIFGNHDKVMRDGKIRGQFVEMYNFHEINIADSVPRGVQSITLCHFPMLSWNKSHYGSWNLFGHVHDTWVGNCQQLNVGVDCHGCTPISYEEVKAKLKTLPPRNEIHK